MQPTRRRLLGLASAGLASLAGCAGLVGGREQWTFQTGQNVEGPRHPRIKGGPVVGSGTVYLGSLDWRVYALDAATGDERWRFEADGPVWTPPTLDDRTLLVTSHSRNVVYALSATDGELQWKTPLADQGLVTTPPRVADGRVFVGSDERIHALDAATGRERWQYSAEQPPLTWGTPLAVDDRLFITSRTPSGSLYAFDAATGDLRWQFSTEKRLFGSPAFGSGTVYLGTDAGTVYAVDATEGTERWRGDAASRIRRVTPVVRQGRVYVATDAGVTVLDAESGERLRRFETDGPVRATPVLRDGVLVVGDHGVSEDDEYTARLYAFDVESGERRWTHEFDAAIEASPAVTEEMVYVGDLSGALHALSR